MQQLQPIVLTGKLVNEKFRGSRRPDPYLRKTNNSFWSETQNSVQGIKTKRATKSIITQIVVEDFVAKANQQEIGKSRFSTYDVMSTQPTNRLPDLPSPTNIYSRRDETGTEFGSTVMSTRNRTAKGGNRDFTANVMDSHATKYDIFNQYIHNVPQSDKIEQANQFITQFAARKEGERNQSIDEKIGAIIAQAQSRSLLGRGAGGFLRQKPVEGYSPEKKAQVVGGIIKDQLQQIKNPTDTNQLLNQRHKLGDEYLPSLRKFVPTHNQQELYKSYNAETLQNHLKAVAKKQSDVHKIKQGEQTKKPNDRSLYEKQQQLLINAQFQQPYKQEILKATRQSRVEGWMLKEMQQKLTQVKQEEFKHEPKPQKQVAEGESSGSSKYSLGSSDEDSPYRAKLQQPNHSMHQKKRWNDVQEEENERLSKKWQLFFDKPLPAYVEGEVHAQQNVNTIKPQVKQEFTNDQFKQYYFDLEKKINLVTDNLTQEQQSTIDANMEVRIAKRNKNFHRIRELYTIVTDHRIKNLQALQDFEGRYTFETQREIEQLIKKRQSLMEDAGDMNFSIYGEDKEEIVPDPENFDQSAQRLMMVTDKQVTMDKFGKSLLYDIIKLGIQEKRIDAKVLNLEKQKNEDESEEELQVTTTINKAVFKRPSITVNNVPALNLQSIRITNKNMVKVETANSSFSSFSKIEPTLKKAIFHQSIVKNRFYDLAKKTKHDEVNGEAFAMVKFFDSCEQSQISAVPIFSKIYEGKLSIIGQYINKDLAKAIGEMLENLNDSKDLQFDELNFDYNGMKDDQFYSILKSLSNHKTVKKITYVNNEMGRKSIQELNKLLSGEGGIQLQELRLSGVKASSQDLELLLKGLSSANSLQCLKLSNLQINDSVLVRELTRGVHQLIELRELNLSYQGFLAIQLNQIMIAIAENYPKLVVLNLSGNPLPLRDNKHSIGFLDNLIKMIQSKVNRLADLDLSDMNLRDRVEKLAWPLAQNETLQSIHLSNNQIPQSILTDLLLVFGIKNSEKEHDTFSHFKKTYKLTPRIVLKDGKLAVSKVHSILGDESSHDIVERKQNNILISEKDKFIKTLGEATAQIANSEQIKDAIEKKKYVQCQTQQGLLFTQVKQQPVVISRVLCHNELIFNTKPEKNTHFEKGSVGKWRISDNCWLCNKHRYTVLVFNRELAQKHWIEVTDIQRINQIRQKYHLDDSEKFVGEKEDSIRIMGSVTDNVVSNMLPIQLFNILLDNEGLVANFGEKAQSVTDETIEVAFGEDRNLKKVLEEKNRTDSYKEMYSNLPFPASQVSIVGVSSKYELHGDNYDPVQLINTQSTERLKPSESLYRNVNIFVFAGYMKPGKHQIIIHDRLHDVYYVRDIIIDIRTCEVLSNVYQNHKFYTSTVKKIFNPYTGDIMMDLSSSVFMNFRRITTSTVNSCFTHDMQFCRMRNIIEDEDDLQQTKECIMTNYAIFVKFFHTISAQFPEFPEIEFQRLPEVFKLLDLMPLQLAQEMLDGVLTKYKQFRADVHKGFKLNRMCFLETILLYVEEIHDLDRQKINENEKIQDIYMARKNSQRYKQSLNSFLKAFQKHTNDDIDMENGLTKFRVQYVWVNSVNQIFYANLQGLMNIFNKYRPSDKGFTQRSSIKLLEDAKIKLSADVAKRQFNLAQMTVFDELNASNEYLEMEFVEWLEFIVRVCYANNKATTNSDIQVVSHGPVFSMTEHEMESRLAQTVTELLQLVNVTYVEPAKVKVVPALDEKDYKKLAQIK